MAEDEELKVSRGKSNWEQILEQDPDLRMAQTERLKIIVLKPGELELRLSYHAYQGNFRYDIRMYALIEGLMRPTKRGVVIFPSQIDEFIRTLIELAYPNNLGGDPTNQT